MKNELVRGVLLALSIGLAPLAAGQTINYKVGSSSTVSVTSGQDITINVGTVTGTVLLRIWDPALVNGLPDDDVGKITISGSLGTDGELQVLVAGPSSTWPTSPLDDLAFTGPGLRHLGLAASDGIEVTNADLRVRTRLAAFTSDDIRGVIEVGQVQRVQAGFRPPGGIPNPGTISASVTSLTTFNEFNQDAIGYISAGNGITGNITALGSVTFNPIHPSTYASIGRIVVGPSTSSGVGGISGDMIAQHGAIRSIFTTGPISNGETDPADYVKITAGNGVGEIRTTAESGGTILARDVYAKITAHATMLDDPENFPYASPANEGQLELLEVGGDLRGEIRAANLVGSSQFVIRRGIFVHGICYAPITIDFVVDHGNIIAQTFVAPIRIGRTLQGALVATGGAQTPDPAPPGFLDGHIPSITIGDIPDESLPAFVLNQYSPNARGLVGIFGIRTTIPEGEEWFTASPPTLGSAIDGCVRAAHSIGEADIASLTTQTKSTPNNTPPCTKYAPVVEAPVIGSLYIQDLATGTVWSGQHDEYDPDSVYAAIDDLRIGRVASIAADGEPCHRIAGSSGDRCSGAHLRPDLSQPVAGGGAGEAARLPCMRGTFPRFCPADAPTPRPIPPLHPFSRAAGGSEIHSPSQFMPDRATEVAGSAASSVS